MAILSCSAVAVVTIALRIFLVRCSSAGNETIVTYSNNSNVSKTSTTQQMPPTVTTIATVGNSTVRNPFGSIARPDIGRIPLRHSVGRGLSSSHDHVSDSRGGPYFEEGHRSQNVTVRLGTNVTLDCSIALLQNRTVAWVRFKERFMDLLTLGKTAHSKDDRISLSFRYPSNYRLQINYVTSRDEGLYECQVAVAPTKISKQFFVKVTAPVITIVDESGRNVTERYYKAGSTLELTCLARQATDPGSDHPITWRHGDRTLTKGISSNGTSNSDTIISTLKLAPVQRRHSGNYTCAVGDLATESVSVHVLNGELPAAVHHGNLAPQRVAAPWLLVSHALASALARLR